MPFTKPTVKLRQAKVAVHQALGMAVPADPRRSYTDTMEWLSKSVLLGYKGGIAGYPTANQKAAALAGANLAQTIIRKANDNLAAIIFMRRPEPPLLTQVVASHFKLIAGNNAGGTLTDNIVNKPFSLGAVTAHDRRWALNRIREGFLSISFHLNTGVYMIDTDHTRRDIRTGFARVPAPNPDEEAYVSWQKTNYDGATWRYTHGRWVGGLTCGLKHGEIHISLENMENYSAISYARVIIHEATHKFLNTDDNAYAHQNTYAGLSLNESLNNADSYAWAAVSLYCGNVKMPNTGAYHPDWAQCTRP